MQFCQETGVSLIIPDSWQVFYLLRICQDRTVRAGCLSRKLHIPIPYSGHQMAPFRSYAKPRLKLKRHLGLGLHLSPLIGPDAHMALGFDQWSFSRSGAVAKARRSWGRLTGGVHHFTLTPCVSSPPLPSASTSHRELSCALCCFLFSVRRGRARRSL